MPKPGFNGNGRPLNVAAARDEINRIRRDRGIIDDYDESQIRKTDSSFQEDYRRRAAEHRALYARYTRTVAEQLYSSRFRLIYELLQNGDDSCYASDIEPSITFRIKPSELIIESNELGFTLENVESICDTGKSSKASNADTTGEKGLGFKSVFGIADYVHIQSGLWSFRFEHSQGEEGVGMITPVWTDVTSLLPSNVGTRLTLRYYDQRDIFATRLVSEFEKLPKTIMFALRKLEKLVVVVDGVAGRSDRMTFEKGGDLRSDEIRITTTVTGNFGAHTSATTWLRLFQYTVSDLPSDTHRTSSESDVTVAFEVDSDGLPVIPTNGQHVFAYLPVQRIIQLPFLINANFILTANRESVPDTDWNNALRVGVSRAFVGLVDKIVTSGDPLEFTWMRYLPQKPMQGFWEWLWADIQAELSYRASPILRSRRDELHSIEHMTTLPDWFIHENEPIVADTDEDIYLSDHYESSDVRILEDLGVRQISVTQILERIQLGLSQSAERPIHHIPLDDPWHTAFAALIQRLLRRKSIKKDVERLRIIPLDDNRWVSTLSLRVDAVYLPYLVDEDSVSIKVPDGLGFNKLHETAAADGERASFYTSLGITSCPPDAVTASILEMHQSCKRTGTMFTFKTDLEILFWFGKRPSLLTQSQKRLLLVSDENKLLQGPFLFFPSEDNYHAEKLLAATPKEDLHKCGYGILDKEYLNSQVANHIRHGLDWRSYLQRWGVKDFPDLVHEVSAGWKLHSLMELIARDNPDSFVANLKAHWSDYRVDASRIKNDLKNVRVPCLNDSTQRLCDTILPTHELMDMRRDPNLTNLLPFLKLPRDYDTQQSEAWYFLKEFGVICEVNASFYLRAMYLLADLGEDHLLPTCEKIYSGIAQTTAVGDAKAVQQQEFATRPMIRSKTTEEAWYRSTDCIWEGPSFLQAKQVLSPLYGANQSASSFFKTILNMRNVSYNDLIDELKMLSTKATAGSPLIESKAPKVYAALDAMANSEPVIEAIRQELNGHGLIYVGQKWLKPSECLWNCTVAISGRLPLDHVYPQLKKFFVDKMKVRTMNINVLLQELGRTAKKTSPDVDEVKRIILTIGELLASDREVQVNEEQLRALEKTAFLPVRGANGLKLFSVDQAFTIKDHPRYGQLFENQTKILDFGHEEMTSLYPLFELLGLQNRFLSALVESKTTVDKATAHQALQHYIRDRAYALSCCATYYNSSEYYNRKTTMHELLLAADVFVCEEMWTELMLPEEYDSVTVQSDRAVVDICFLDGKLTIYVPSDYDSLYSCFHTELPQALANALSIDNERAVKVVYRILNDNKKDLDTIMKDEDLPEYPWFAKPVPSRQTGSFPALGDAEPNSSSMPTPASPTDASSDHDHDHDHDVVVTRVDQQSTAPYARAESSIPSPVHVRSTGSHHTIWEEVARDQQYKRLLREVIRQARRGARSPQRRGGSLSLDGIDEALDELAHPPADYAAFKLTFGDTGNGRFEENARVGAAGELYVFEFLKACGVTNFGIDQWQSSIRHYVNILPEYADEPSWQGREISDIMYEGNCPRLMELLRENTTLPYPAWLGLESGATSMSTPVVNYHIEVKTTSGPCNTPFFMSSNQYRLMRDKACPHDSTTAPRDLYLIMRVFNLFSSRIGLQVYVNPWHLRETALEFVADPWKVVPL
ncbi:hypothetical protein G647_10310 [Cladophialophora carrionii CBS 160.54]|uniref:Protein NO VEIN C-terminal domain-containing protein n=1 Tax=Cladophialophora carrionii CBS 160.54 TaxID=1279043 RepID=V9DJ17_9EURO|nr:uncharacterized protein G647_10310 [Cladophialophora carrionii CBS 160.54]ETI26864.1 hypothetical protein G647_10310 [Cladophialophora carrionii CBS 160.54]